MNKAVFLDRDGTINVEKYYLHTIDELEIIDDVPSALKRLRDAGFKLIVISNQAGVGKGYYPIDDVYIVNEEIQRRLKKHNVFLDEYYFCPHTDEDNCPNRKPGIGFVLEAQKKYNLDLSKCFFIGDKLTDVKAGQNAGMPGILVLTGFGENQRKLIHNKQIFPDYIAASLTDAVDWILKRQ